HRVCRHDQWCLPLVSTSVREVANHDAAVVDPELVAIPLTRPGPVDRPPEDLGLRFQLARSQDDGDTPLYVYPGWASSFAGKRRYAARPERADRPVRTRRPQQHTSRTKTASRTAGICGRAGMAGRARLAYRGEDSCRVGDNRNDDHHRDGENEPSPIDA